MKKTNKELAEFYGLKVGDTVKIYDESGISDYDLTFNVVLRDDIKLIRTDRGNGTDEFDPWIIADRRYEVIKPKKKVGETLCSEHLCMKCPLHILYCYRCLDNFDVNWPLYRVLNEMAYKGGLKSDNPIYLAFRAELDKEVE